MSWKTLSSTEKYANRFMKVTEDVVLTDHNKKIIYGVVHKKPAVVIIPWDGNRFTLVGQYRYSVDQYSWEFPAGHYEHDSIEEAARAELKEETGLTTDNLEEIGVFNIAPGHLSQVCHTFLATNLHKGTQKLERSEEGMQTKQVTLDEMKDMIRRGEIKDGLTLTSLQLLELHLAV